jgi:polyribonucleotide nucleotidyltransferase
MHYLFASGRRETLIQNEVTRLLRDEFLPRNEEIAAAYRTAITDATNSIILSSLRDHIHERLMQQGFGIAASKGFRSDGRPLNAVRPVSATVPMFPDCVHGSSLFSRGETQVLSTATISEPREGLSIVNPLSKSLWNEVDVNNNKDDERIPIGSLRFLRSQVELECK